jgi:ParB family chromosome partitioning protein|tara:strand:- start:3464 stop:4318 length:855 start_codon:yes stop_codon:yes gene_type:complete
MNKKQNGLGKGISAILPSTQNFSEIDISTIQTNPFQPRNKFDESTLEELASSIIKLGIIQPITVRKISFNKYQLISGERRLRASRIAKLIKIPAFIRIADDQKMLEMSLVENIQRENLNPIDIALSFKRLIDECNLTQEECSERVGKNRTTITNSLRLLKLPEEIQIYIQNKKISASHARPLLSLEDKESQINLCEDIISNLYTVREVEQIVKTFKESGYISTKKKGGFIKPTIPFKKQHIIHEVSKYLNTKIKLKITKKGNGNIIIPFSSNNDLDYILDKLKK